MARCNKCQGEKDHVLLGDNGTTCFKQCFRCRISDRIWREKDRSNGWLNQNRDQSKKTTLASIETWKRNVLSAGGDVPPRVIAELVTFVNDHASLQVIAENPRPGEKRETKRSSVDDDHETSSDSDMSPSPPSRRISRLSRPPRSSAGAVITLQHTKVTSSAGTQDTDSHPAVAQPATLKAPDQNKPSFLSNLNKLTAQLVQAQHTLSPPQFIELENDLVSGRLGQVGEALSIIDDLVAAKQRMAALKQAGCEASQS